jgi:hypothetical protein
MYPLSPRNLISSDVWEGFQVRNAYKLALERVGRAFGLEKPLGTIKVAESLMTLVVYVENRNT